MKKNQKIALGVGVVAGLGALLWATSSSAADDPGKPDTPDTPDDPYVGPKPNGPPDKPGKPKPKPDPKKTPKKKRKDRPAVIDPGSVWVSEDCEDVYVGADWLGETALPAITAWVEAGFGEPLILTEATDVSSGADRVAFEVIEPAAPDCAAAVPFLPTYVSSHPMPTPPKEPDYTGMTEEQQEEAYNAYIAEYSDFNAALTHWNESYHAAVDAYAQKYPKMHALVGAVYMMVTVVWGGINGQANVPDINMVIQNGNKAFEALGILAPAPENA